MTASEVAAAAARARAAGAALRDRGLEARLDGLARTLDAWRRDDSPWRRRLERELPTAAGFSPEVVREGLRLGLAEWSGERLRGLASQELGALGGATAAAGFPLTAVLLAGSIPMPSLLALLLPLMVGSPVLAKTASRDPVTAPLVAASLKESDPALGDALEVVDFRGHDAAATDALLAAECVVATGSDETVADVASRVGPPRRLLTFGHRLSLAVLGPDCSDADVRSEATRGLALDVALWDQLGCLSPIAAYVVGAPADAVARELAEHLAELAETLPRGEVGVSAATLAAHERSEAELRAAVSGEVAVHTDAGHRYCVVREADARPRPAPLHRFVRVHPVADRKALGDALESLAPHLAGVALAGFGPETDAAAEELLALGASRVCAPGRLQAPPLDWHRDGQPLLLPLVRLGDRELA